MCLLRCILAGSLAVFGSSFLSGVANADTILTMSTDPINGVYDTVAGGDSTASMVGGVYAPGFSNPGETVERAIDGDLTTKFAVYNTVLGSVVNTGFYVTATRGKSVLRSIQFATANDCAGRDPKTITIEGTNAGDLTSGSVWAVIYSGSAGLDVDPGRQTWGDVASIDNSAEFTDYRVLVTSVRDIGGDGYHCMQFSDVRLSGNIVPEPATLSFILSGMVGLAAYAWHRH